MNDSFSTISKNPDFITCLAMMLKIFLNDSDSSYFMTTTSELLNHSNSLSTRQLYFVVLSSFETDPKKMSSEPYSPLKCMHLFPTSFPF